MREFATIVYNGSKVVYTFINEKGMENGPGLAKEMQGMGYKLKHLKRAEDNGGKVIFAQFEKIGKSQKHVKLSDKKIERLQTKYDVEQFDSSCYREVESSETQELLEKKEILKGRNFKLKPYGVILTGPKLSSAEKKQLDIKHEKRKYCEYVIFDINQSDPYNFTANNVIHHAPSDPKNPFSMLEDFAMGTENGKMTIRQGVKKLPKLSKKQIRNILKGPEQVGIEQKTWYGHKVNVPRILKKKAKQPENKKAVKPLSFTSPTQS